MSIVYFWLREDLTPYYIGYGSHKTRMYSKHPRKNSNFVPRPNTKFIHYWEFTDNTKGKLREWEMINFLKPMLCNIEPGYPLNPIYYGKDNPFYGKKHSDETKQKISRGKMGQTHSEKTKRKLSKSHMGEKNINYGTSRDKKTREKISNTLKGRTSYTRTEETKRKLSESCKKRWENWRKNKMNNITYYSENRDEGDI